jgi:hypothetical protein
MIGDKNVERYNMSTKVNKFTKGLKCGVKPTWIETTSIYRPNSE